MEASHRLLMFDVRLSGRFRIAIVVVTLGLLSVFESGAASEIAIHFKRGAYDAQVSVNLSSMHDEKSYLVAVKAGQDMKIKVDAAGGGRGTVIQRVAHRARRAIFSLTMYCQNPAIITSICMRVRWVRNDRASSR